MRSGQRFLIVLMCCTGFAVPAAARLSGAIFDNADIDHDGRTSRAEFAAAREKQFDRLDRNHDGVVSRDDFGRLMRLRPQAAGRLDRWIAEIDGNHDGKVTREELRAAPMPLFDRADTNHDGYVDAAELKVLRTAADTTKDGGGL